MKKSISLVLLISLLYGCDEPNTETTETNGDSQTHSNKPGVVEIVTNQMDFQAPDTILSGWTTFIYNNKSNETHFFLFEKYPEGKNLEDAKREVVPAFQKGMDFITAGNTDSGYAAFGELPEWFTKVEIRGGSGLIGPGKKSQTTLKLEPGTYLIECYVKMPNGHFHTSMGMIKQIEILGEEGEGKIPASAIDIKISGTNGIESETGIKAGASTFAVHFSDQKAHENFMGHDVHLVRLSEGSDVKQLESWMNWLNPKGFISPAPGGFEFLGGTQEMPAGSTAYFSADLRPGNYALIAEVPEASKKNMIKLFSVPE